RAFLTAFAIPLAWRRDDDKIEEQVSVTEAGESPPEFPKMPFALRAAAVALAGGLFFASQTPAFSQSQEGEQKPTAPQTTEEKAKEEKAKEARAKAAREFAEAAKLPKNAGLPECLWTGRLAASLLYRNDVDTTKRYMDLYDRFGCPADH